MLVIYWLMLGVNLLKFPRLLVQTPADISWIFTHGATYRLVTGGVWYDRHKSRNNVLYTPIFPNIGFVKGALDLLALKN